jgi:hypothetical protein
MRKMHIDVLLLKHECYVKVEINYVEKNYAYELSVFVRKCQ